MAHKACGDVTGTKTVLADRRAKTVVDIVSTKNVCVKFDKAPTADEAATKIKAEALAEYNRITSVNNVRIIRSPSYAEFMSEVYKANRKAGVTLKPMP